MSLVDDSHTAYGLQEKPHDRGRSPPGPEDNNTSGAAIFSFVRQKYAKYKYFLSYVTILCLLLLLSVNTCLFCLSCVSMGHAAWEKWLID